MISKKKYIGLFFCVICLALTLTVPVVQAAEDTQTEVGEEQTDTGESTETSGQKTPEFKTFADLKGKTVAMLTGAPFEELIKSKAPDVGSFQYFANLPDMTLALKSGKIDAYLMNSAIAALMKNRNSDLAIFPENLGEAPFGIAFTKGGTLRSEWQQAFDAIDHADIEKAWEKWTGADDSVKVLPEQDWPGANGEVKVAACDTLEPMSYRGEDGQVIGFDIEIILMMAKQLDKKVKITGMEFASVMPEVQSGKSDVGCGSIMITEERSELVDFVEYYPGAYQLVVRADSEETKSEGFFEGLKESFYRTFIREGRYKMVLTGLLLTVLMAVASGLIGALIGFGLVFLRRKNIGFFNGFIRGYTALIAGIPVVVILMVLYYIVFGAVDIPAVIVAIIGFSLIFATRVYTTVWNAVQSVDIGQQEAAYALGYTDKMAFRKILLPQARPIYVPLLESQFVMLVKETSVAGYITVVDLTRAGDLIRSRTMEAFFPLIAIAVIYFLLTFFLAHLIRVASRERRKKHREYRLHAEAPVE